MVNEQINQDNNQPNEAYDIWKNVSNGIAGQNEENPTSEIPENNNVDTSQSEENELTPEQIEWREGHTDEEIDALAEQWDNWMDGVSWIGRHHGDMLTDIYHDKELGWKFSDFKEFFDNSWYVDNQTPRNRDGETVGWRLNQALESLKQALGEESPEYKSAARKILIDIRQGKYKGSRLSYDYGYEPDMRIIFANQEELIEEDDEERKKAEEEEKRQLEEQDKRRQEAWEKSWRNPNNNAAYKENMEAIDRRTFGYLNKIVSNLDEIAPAAKDLVMDTINQKILEGVFNGAYLNNQGYFYTGKMAEEYRGYEQNRNENDSDGDKPPVSPIPRPNAGRKKPETKTPEDFGFRDWKN